MKIKGILFTLLACFSTAFGQQPLFQPLNNTERMNIEFAVQSTLQPDTAVINAIDLEQYELLRHETKRVEVLDKNSGYTLILFSKTEVKDNRKNLPARPFFKPPRSDKKEVQ